jgi:tRNA(fMet)-specific endonuclease VapC
LIQSYHERHSKWIPDALIASIALAENLEILTYNRKDFDFIDDIKLFNPK